MSQKKLLFVTVSPVLPEIIGGSEWSLYSLIRKLEQDNWLVEVISFRGIYNEHCENKYLKDLFYTFWRAERLLSSYIYRYINTTSIGIKKDKFSNSTCYRCNLRLPEFKSFIEKRLSIFNPHFVCGQNTSADLLTQYHFLDWIAGQGYPTFCFIRNEPEAAQNLPNTIIPIANSPWMQNKIKEIANRDSELILPVIDPDLVKTVRHELKHITFINPVDIKGVDLAIEIAKSMPEEKFLFVKSKWGGIDYTVRNPKIAEMKTLANVVLMEVQTDIRKVYESTKLLLVPSQYQEPFCRVVIEAQMNSIPVVASNNGGLPYTVGEGGICISSQDDKLSYISAIRDILSENNYSAWCKKALKNSLRSEFNCKVQVNNFKEVLYRHQALISKEHSLIKKKLHVNPITIVIVPRQQLGAAECLQRIYNYTEPPFEVILVGFSKLSDEERLKINNYPNLKLLWSDKYLYPYEAKNLALKNLNQKSKWVVFIDNDVKVHKSWLTHMLHAAEKEEAGAVHPLYLFENNFRARIHMANGLFRKVNGMENGFEPFMNLCDESIAAAINLKRIRSDFVEFHCWMIKKELLDQLKQFAPLTIGEHIHHSLLLHKLNQKIIFEPKSVVTYISDVDDSPLNQQYLKFRWGKQKARESVDMLTRYWPDFSEHWASKVQAANNFIKANKK